MGSHAGLPEDNQPEIKFGSPQDVETVSAIYDSGKKRVRQINQRDRSGEAGATLLFASILQETLLCAGRSSPPWIASFSP
jgi:hypothetical protein